MLIVKVNINECTLGRAASVDWQGASIYDFHPPPRRWLDAPLTLRFSRNFERILRHVLQLF